MKHFLSLLLTTFVVVAQATTSGTLPGEFPINSDGDKVQFSMGNLIYDPVTKSFSFATEQSALGSYFGWGTSGYHDLTDDLNTHYQPTDKTISYDAANTANKTGYGPSFVETMDSYSQRDITWNSFDGCRYSNYDWGVYNPITNGGNQAGLWRTLTQDEWLYLLHHSNPQWTTIDEVPGLQLTADDGKSTVFLPAAGYRGLNTKTATSGTPAMHELNEQCNYWSATAVEANSLNAMTMNYKDNTGEVVSYNRFNGFSVRLVLDAASPSWITLSDRNDNHELLEEYKYGESGDKHGLLTNVHLERTLYSDGWNTLCLPFDVAAEQCEKVFGAGCKLYTFAGATLSDDQTDLQIVLEPATEITAGTPYIIQPAIDIVNPDFYNCTVTCSAGSGETIVDGSDLQFVGIINPYQLTPGDKRYLFVTAGDELNWSKAGDTSSMYGMRAYFYVPDMQQSPMAAAKRAHLVIRPYTIPTNLDDNSKFIIQNSKLIINGQFVIIKDNKMYNAWGVEF